MPLDAKSATRLMGIGCIAVAHMDLEVTSGIHKEHTRKHELTKKIIPYIIGAGNLTYKSNCLLFLNYIIL